MVQNPFVFRVIGRRIWRHFIETVPGRGLAWGKPYLGPVQEHLSMQWLPGRQCCAFGQMAECRFWLQQRRWSFLVGQFLGRACVDHGCARVDQQRDSG